MSSEAPPDPLRQQILELVRRYARENHAEFKPGGREAFTAGTTTVPYAGRVFGPEEVEALVGASLDFWLTLGGEGTSFERELAAWLGVKSSVLTNSGSSANLLALTTLTSPKLPASRRLRAGDEVITCAAGFPTTVFPIVQAGAVPVFIDALPSTANPDCAQLAEALRPGKTKAVMMAHTLGNPFDLATVLEFCERHELWLIEDNCDALGSVYTRPGQAAAMTGTFGDLSTQSFYPPHHLTMGEGGAVNVVRHPPLRRLVESFRDWGRDCWCPSGHDDTCGKRFGWQQGELPAGYDHKYIYSHFGYNLKPLDLQAAVGRVQLARLNEFGEARRRNWQWLRRELADLEEWMEFSLPTHASGWTPDGFHWDDSGCQSDPSWFGFMMLIRPTAGFDAVALSRHLDQAHIGNRRLFGGNLVRQPAFVGLRAERPGAFRQVGTLAGADRLMRDAVFIGVYPGMTVAMLTHMAETLVEFCHHPKTARPEQL